MSILPPNAPPSGVEITRIVSIGWSRIFASCSRTSNGAWVGLQIVTVPSGATAPRRLPGFEDTIKVVSGLDVDDGLVAQLYNPMAAFPSMHLAFAVVTAAGAHAMTTRAPLRAAALAYPPAVAFTVLATANHFVLDVLAGTALGVAAVRISQAIGR